MEYRKIVEVEFVEFDEYGLQKSWEWLNDPEIKHLTSRSDFDRESQREWYDSLKTRDDYYVRTVSVLGRDKLIGVCGLKKINSKDAEMWGYIGEKSYWGITIGPQMIEHLMQHGGELGLDSLYFGCLKENRLLIKTAKRFGFELEKEINEKDIIMRRLI